MGPSIKKSGQSWMAHEVMLRTIALDYSYEIVHSGRARDYDVML
jgi:hypothetical protein